MAEHKRFKRNIAHVAGVVVNEAGEWVDDAMFRKLDPGVSECYEPRKEDDWRWILNDERIFISQDPSCAGRKGQFSLCMGLLCVLYVQAYVNGALKVSGDVPCPEWGQGTMMRRIQRNLKGESISIAFE